MTDLIVVAHPDDEVLGAGATIHKLTQAGETVHLCVLCAMAAVRSQRPSNQGLLSDMRACMDVLGMGQSFLGDFPNIKMNTTPHLELVQFIERAIEATGATRIITHHPADLNNDHVQTSIACQAAVRLFQRRPDVPALEELWYMEVPSSTEWALNTAASDFRPNVFVEVGQEGVEKKLEALACYRGVVRPYPHPRSPEGISGLAAYRGSQSGCRWAEAFECAVRRMV